MSDRSLAANDHNTVISTMDHIFLAGNFLSKSTGITSPCEELAQILTSKVYKVVSSFHHQNRVLRMADMLWTALKSRHIYYVSLLEVYSYLAFRWAELLSILLRILGKPYILSLHGGLLPEFADRHPNRFSSLINSADVVTTPSRKFCDLFSTIRSDLVYLPNGVELAHYQVKVRLNPKPKFCWMHSFNSTYNPTLALQMLALLSKDYPDASLSMIGPDSRDGTLDQFKILLNDLRLSEQVKIIGAIPKFQVAQHLSKGDIFINTTNVESFGVSTLEAAACGLCIITTDAGELPYLWEDGVDALIVPKNDAAAMAEAAIRVLSEPGLAAKLSANARKKAENYDWSKILPLWDDLFTKVRNEKLM
jgi:glycosyltransferase involved in cell wall biosynthesis